MLGELELLDRSSQTRLLAVLTAASMGARSDVWHRGSRNVSGATRHILQVHFGRQVSNTRFPPYLVDGGDSAFTVTEETIAAPLDRGLPIGFLYPVRVELRQIRILVHANVALKR